MAAAVEWDRRGVPDRPGAWLTTTAWRKALDRLRHEQVAAAHAPELVPTVSYDFELFDESSLEDDQLRLLFTCCHPALAPEARMALTLRSVAGLTVPEIARGFLSTDSAMERRLTRARNKVSDARIPFRVPTDDLLVERLAGVLRVVYLVFNEGHALRPGAARGGDPAGAAARAADARRGRGPWAAGAVPAHRRALGARASVDGELVVARRAGPRPLGSRRDRRGRARPRARAAAPAAGLLRDPGRDRRRAREAPDFDADRLGADRRPLRASCCATTRRRWWRSTAPSRSASPRARRPGSRCCPTIRASSATRPLYAARFELLRRTGDAAAAAARSTPRSPSRPTRPSATRSAT